MVALKKFINNYIAYHYKLYQQGTIFRPIGNVFVS